MFLSEQLNITPTRRVKASSARRRTLINHLARTPEALWRLGYNAIDLWGPTSFLPSPRIVAIIIRELLAANARVTCNPFPASPGTVAPRDSNKAGNSPTASAVVWE